MFRTVHYMEKRAVNPAHGLALCYAGMLCLAIAVNLMPILLTTVRVDLGGKAVLTDEQLGRISALTFAGIVGENTCAPQEVHMHINRCNPASILHKTIAFHRRYLLVKHSS